MDRRVLIWDGGHDYVNYKAALSAVGLEAVVSADREEAPRCAALLLPGGGDMEPWRYGQENIACRDLEPERDALELDLLADFTALGKPVLGICRGMQTINVFFGGTLYLDLADQFTSLQHWQTCDYSETSHLDATEPP